MRPPCTGGWEEGTALLNVEAGAASQTEILLTRAEGGGGTWGAGRSQTEGFLIRAGRGHNLFAVFVGFGVYVGSGRLEIPDRPSSLGAEPQSRALRRGVDTEHKTKGWAQPVNVTDRAGQPGCNSAHLHDAGLFIISRQHTQAWNIAAPSHWVLPAGKKQGAWRRRRNANERPLLRPRDCVWCSSSTPALFRVFLLPLSLSDTEPHVLTINQRLQPH